jgi:hypothetical protein
LDIGFIDHFYTPLETTIAVPLLISTIHRSPQQLLSLFPACCVFNSCSLATASNSGDSSAFRDHVFAVRRISINRTPSAGLGYSLYSLGADPTENIASSILSIVIMGGCPAIEQISIPRERVYRAVTKQWMFLLVIVA